MTEQQKINDFTPDNENRGGGYPFGSQMKLDELTDNNFIIYRFFIKDDEKFGGERAIMEASKTIDSEHFIVSVKSTIIIEQLKTNHKNLPMRVALQKKQTQDGERSYWTFLEPK